MKKQDKINKVNGAIKRSSAATSTGMKAELINGNIVYSQPYNNYANTSKKISFKNVLFLLNIEDVRNLTTK